MVALAVSQSLATLEWLGGHFSPATLFATSEPGVWYDPSDVANTNWLYNLLTFTEQFDNSYWTKLNASVTANTIVAPDGTTTADFLIPDTANSQHGVYRGIPTNSGVAYTQSVYAKAGGYNWLYMTEANNVTAQASFNLATGVLGTVSGTGSPSATITAVGNGWYRCTLTFTPIYTISNIQARANNANGGSSFIGDGTSGIYIWGAQLELGSTATTYQPITTVDAGTIARFPYATLYQDSAGTTPVTAPNQPVGLMLDKSQGLVLGPQLVTNGNFDSGTTGWVYPGGTGGGGGITVSDGRLRLTVATPLASIQDRMVYTELTGLTVGRSYAFSGFMIALTGTVEVRLTVTAVAIDAEGNGILGTTASQSGETITSIFTATATTMYVHGYARGTVVAGSQVAFDNISVKLLPGNHATQSTSGSRPTYGIVPATGRRNLLTYSEQIGGTNWSLTGTTVSADAATSPNGTTTADLLSQTAVSLEHFTEQTGLQTTVGTYTASYYVKAGTVSSFQIMVVHVGLAPTTSTGTFTISSGIITYTSGLGIIDSGSAVDVGGGWYRCSISYTLSGSVTSHRTRIYAGLSGVFLGNAANNLLIWGAQLETGSTATAYQKVVTAFEVTEANVASLSYISFDGIDDFMVTPTITPATDKVQVFAGVRKLSDATIGVIVELGTGSGNGLLFLTGPRAASGDYGFFSKGTVGVDAQTANLFSSPVTNILTGIGDIAEPVSTIRVNGVQRATSASTQGTGNYLAYPMYIGRRAGTTLPFNGQMYGLITRFGANLNTSQLVSTEGWMNTKTRPL